MSHILGARNPVQAGHTSGWFGYSCPINWRLVVLIESKPLFADALDVAGFLHQSTIIRCALSQCFPRTRFFFHSSSVCRYVENCQLRKINSHSHHPVSTLIKQNFIEICEKCWVKKSAFKYRMFHYFYAGCHINSKLKELGSLGESYRQKLNNKKTTQFPFLVD